MPHRSYDRPSPETHPIDPNSDNGQFNESAWPEFRDDHGPPSYSTLHVAEQTQNIVSP